MLFLISWLKYFYYRESVAPIAINRRSIIINLRNVGGEKFNLLSIGSAIAGVNIMLVKIESVPGRISP